MPSETARLMEVALWNRGGVEEEPGGHDPTYGSRRHDDSNRSRAAVMRLNVVRKPLDEAGSAAITANDLYI
jgi:hypothetical protein